MHTNKNYFSQNMQNFFKYAIVHNKYALYALLTFFQAFFAKGILDISYPR